MSGEKIPPIGTLTDRVQLRRRQVTGEDAGGHDVLFVPIATVWSRVRPLSARQAIVTNGRAVEASHAVVLRFRSDLKPRDRMVFRGRTLEVISAEDMNGRRAYLRCLCSETRVTG